MSGLRMQHVRRAFVLSVVRLCQTEVRQRGMPWVSRNTRREQPSDWGKACYGREGARIDPHSKALRWSDSVREGVSGSGFLLT